MHVGDRIKVVRDFFGLSQQQLAAMSGLTHTQISQIERQEEGRNTKYSSVVSTASALEEYNKSNKDKFQCDNIIYYILAPDNAPKHINQDFVINKFKIFLHRASAFGVIKIKSESEIDGLVEAFLLDLTGEDIQKEHLTHASEFNS